jgi:Cu(I)/Ag(I) efflux system membrane fusion protein
MRAVLRAFLIVLLVAVSVTGGFVASFHVKPEWLAFAATLRADPSAMPGERKVLYYRNPMGLPDTSPTPKKDSMGMDYVAVYADDEPEAASARKVLYYRNPMGLPDTSPVPKKDSMGMDYIAVYAEEGEAESDPSVVKVGVEKVQRAGVRSEPVELRVLAETIHVPGTVQLDERRQRSITMRVEGFIEEVYAGATGQTVKAGEPLFRIYSPAIVQAQVEYRIAAAAGQREAGSRKLRNYGVPESFITSIPKTGTLPFSLDWPSPVAGVLMTKNIVPGQRVMPGDELYRLADVSTVWVMADVPEQDAGRVHVGDPVSVTVRALPGETFEGKVAFILPELKVETRTAQVRIELPNPDHKLLHQMYADVTIEAARGAAVLSVPSSAIIDSGLRQVAILDLGGGKFAPRAVKLGRRGGEHVEILSGLNTGDKIVTKANFLIDAESNLKAALTALTTAEAGQP